MSTRSITTDCTAEEEDRASGTVRGGPQRAGREKRRGWRRWGGGEGEGRCPGETCSCKCVITAQAGEGGRGLGGGRIMREGKKRKRRWEGYRNLPMSCRKLNGDLS